MNVVLVGLGNVGYGRYVKSKQNKLLDHYSAILARKELDLISVVDSSAVPEELTRIGFRHIDELSKSAIDLLVIATGTESHLDIVRQALTKIQTRLIIVEKPGTKSLADAIKLKDILERTNGTKVYINYQRNYNPVILGSMRNSKLGQFQCGVVHYSNGALNNASHAIALVLDKLGDDTSVQRLSRESRTIGEDLDFEIVNSKGARIIFLSTNERFYSNFRIQLDYEHGVVTYDSSIPNITTRLKIQDPMFAGRYCLEEIGKAIPTNEDKAFGYVYDFLVNKLINEDCSGEVGVSLERAIKIHKIMDRLRND